jgi:hypothetical protein
MSVLRSFLFAGLAAFAITANAGVASYAELCAKGDAQMCRIAELEKQLDMSQFTGENSQFKWVVPEYYTFLGTGSATERAKGRAGEYCARVEKVSISPVVAEYSRLTGVVAVKRAAFQECMKNATENFLRDERKEQFQEVLSVAAIVVPVILAVLALWYRRPLLRWTRGFMSKMNALGPK